MLVTWNCPGKIAQNRNSSPAGSGSEVVSGALINHQVLLLDEPFALDAETRASMQQLLKRIARIIFAITAIFVTHSLKEALVWATAMACCRMEKAKFMAKKAFIDDGDTGAQAEMEFWRGWERG